MLDENLKTQVKALFGNLKSSYTFAINVAASHPSKKELVELLEEVVACSDKTQLSISEGEGLSFSILKDDEQESNIIFRTVPTGHEFTSLLLAVLNMDGIGKNLPDETIQNRIKSLKGEIVLKSYISLTCTNCPLVVQSINVLSILNKNIGHEIIDGSINQAEVDALNIQAVPSVYVNGKVLHVGRSSLGELIEKLEAEVGTNVQLSETAHKEYDVVVVGGGPAGVASAIYSARKGFSVAIVADQIGGQVTETVSIENMISIPKTTGKELSANLKLHLKSYPIDILESRMVKSVELQDGYKQIHTSMGEIFTTPALIISTGASWRKLNVPGEKEYIGSGVAFCVHCDGPFYKNKKVVVVGGGNSGLEAAIDLSSIATEVTLFEYLDELKGDKVLQDKLSTLSNVKIITGVETKSIIGNGKQVTSIEYKLRNKEAVKTLDVTGIFVQIGLIPNSDVFEDLVEINQFGEIKIDTNCRTNVPGIYAAGDVTIVPFKQIVIASGEGTKAALSAFEDKIKDLQTSSEAV